MADGPVLWALARDSRALDLNPAYAYLMACLNFADTSVVATSNGEAVGYVIAYRPGPRPDAVFVWQVTVGAQARNLGLGRRMLEGVLAAEGCEGVRYLEATVTPSNEASWRLFRSVARSVDAEFVDEPCFTQAHFPDDAPHEEERLVRIGPISVDSTRRQHSGNDQTTRV